MCSRLVWHCYVVKDVAWFDFAWYIGVLIPHYLDMYLPNIAVFLDTPIVIAKP